MRLAIPAVLLAGFASTVAAQPDVRPDPSNPVVNVPRPAYESAFTGYRDWTEATSERWREANERVRHLGGHAGHVKPAAKAPAAADKKAPK